MAFFFEDGFLPRGAGLLARAAGFLGAGDLLRAATRFVAVCFGVPSPEARRARVATMVAFACVRRRYVSRLPGASSAS